MDFTLIFNQILVLFSVIFLGFVLNKKNIIDSHTSKKISSFVVNVTTPALIISGMSGPNIERESINLLQIVGVSIICYIFLFVLTLFTPQLLRVQRKDYGVYKFMIMFANVGFMGYPVVSSIYGKEAILYASLFNLPFNFLLYTLGIYFISSNDNKSFKLNWKLFINAGVIAVAIGLFFFFTGLQMPLFLAESITMIGDLTVPLAMLIIGTSLANIPMKTVFLNMRMYLFSILKLIILPVIVWLMFRNIILDELLLGVAVVIVGMPVAANAVMLSKEFDGNEVLASEGVFITTLFSALTIPMLVLLLTH